MVRNTAVGESNHGYDFKDTNIDLSNVQDRKIQAEKEETSSYDKKKEQFSILKNVVIISFAFMLNFTAFNSMANLQSSINERLGTTSLWVVYASIVFSCAFIPSWLIKHLKAKWTLAISMLCYSTYIAAQFYPSYWTLVPTAFLLGLGAAPMWSSKCTYLTQVGSLYGEIVGEDSEVVITRFFGIFFLFFQSSQVWGNLISSTILSKGVVSVNKSESFLETCGANYRVGDKPPESNNSTNTTSEIEQNDDEIHKVIIMSSIYLVSSLLAVVVIALFVDPLSRYKLKKTKAAAKSGSELIVATFVHMGKINQLLIIPMTMWSGFEQGYLGADFTAAFVTCGIGVHMVGYVLICFGVCDAICSVCTSYFVKRVGRVPIFTFAAIINVILLLTMLFWRPNPDHIVVFFVIAALWGVADAVWQTQLNAFYGVIFPGESEAAFSNYRLWESVGYIFSYISSGAVRVDTKIYILFAVLAAAMSGYYLIEIIERRGGIKYKGKQIKTLGEF